MDARTGAAVIDRDDVVMLFMLAIVAAALAGWL